MDKGELKNLFQQTPIPRFEHTIHDKQEIEEKKTSGFRLINWN